MDKYLKTLQKSVEFTRYFNLEGEKKKRKNIQLPFGCIYGNLIIYFQTDYLLKAIKLPILLPSIYTVNLQLTFPFRILKSIETHRH